MNLKILFILSLLLMSRVTIAVEYVLELKDEALVDNDNISLTDIAKFSRQDKVSYAPFRNVDIAKSPLPMYSRTLSRRYIESKIKRALIGIRHTIIWKGSEKVLIRRRSVLYKADDYVNIAQHYLYNKLIDAHYSGVNLKPVGINSDIHLPTGDIEFIPRRNSFTRVSKRNCVWLDVYISGKQWMAVSVWFSVQALRNVYVAKKVINRHKKLNNSDFTMLSEDVAKLAGEPVLSNLSDNKFRLKKKLNKGRILLLRDIELAPDVVKGQEVVVDVFHSAIKLQITAIASDDGFMGDVVTLRNKRSERTFKAVVTGPNRLEIRG